MNTEFGPKATVVKDVEATPENMDKFYAEALLMMTDAVKQRKPIMLMVWEDGASFKQQAVAINDKHCAQVVVGLMSKFPLCFQWACKFVIDYTQNKVAVNNAMMEKKEHGSPKTEH